MRINPLFLLNLCSTRTLYNFWQTWAATFAMGKFSFDAGLEYALLFPEALPIKQHKISQQKKKHNVEVCVTGLPKYCL